MVAGAHDGWFCSAYASHGDAGMNGDDLVDFVLIVLIFIVIPVIILHIW